MEQVLSMLLHASKVAQIWHWKVKSFAQHMALGELYEMITEVADQLAEEYIGKFGETTPVSDGAWAFSTTSPIGFINDLHMKVEEMRSMLPQDAALLNTYDALLGQIRRVKYKLENLS